MEKHFPQLPPKTKALRGLTVLFDFPHGIFGKMVRFLEIQQFQGFLETPPPQKKIMYHLSIFRIFSIFG